MSTMGFGTWLSTAASNVGKAIGSAASGAAAVARTGLGLAWTSRYQILDFLASGAALGVAATVPGMQWKTIGAGVNFVRSGIALVDSLKAASGAGRDPVYTQSVPAKKRKRDMNDAKKAGAPSVDTDIKKPRVSGDMRARMANLASVR